MNGKQLALRFAEECRRLASECVEGTAPPLALWHLDDGYGRHCAIGWALARTEPPRDAWKVFYDIANVTGGSVPLDAPERQQKPDAAVIDANNETPEEERHLAVVFPLLWLADEVERVAHAAR